MKIIPLLLIAQLVATAVTLFTNYKSFTPVYVKKYPPA